MMIFFSVLKHFFFFLRMLHIENNVICSFKVAVLCLLQFFADCVRAFDIHGISQFHYEFESSLYETKANR